MVCRYHTLVTLLVTGVAFRILKCCWQTKHLSKMNILYNLNLLFWPLKFSEGSSAQAMGDKRMSRGRNGLARLQQWQCYQQGPGFECLLRPVEFSACKKVSTLKKSYPKATICAMSPNNLAWKLSRAYVKHLKKYRYYLLKLVSTTLKCSYTLYPECTNYG